MSTNGSREGNYSFGGAPIPHMQGRDLGPLLRGDTPGWRTDWYYEQLFTANDWIPPVEGVRSDRWAYMRYVGMEPPFEELYDLRADPGEEKNLAPRRLTELNQMRSRWDSWRTRLDTWRVSERWSDPG